MLRYDYINKEWIVSTAARGVYRFSSGISMAFGVLFIAVLIQGTFPDINPSLIRAILLIGSLGAAVTWVGMEYFLFRFDDSGALKQVFWFCIMCLPFFGAPLYCFVVYSRSTVVGQASAMSAHASGSSGGVNPDH